MITVTSEMTKSIKTAKGGYTKTQVAAAKEYFGTSKEWLKKLKSEPVTEEFWKKLQPRKRRVKPAKSGRIVNAVETSKDSFWKPTAADIPAIKRKGGNHGLNASKREAICNLASLDFYETREWKELRYRVLKNNLGRCACCGMDSRNDIKLHVDHIKPRSKYPKLALTFENMQVLCEPCNKGKSNKDETDWRPYNHPNRSNK